MVLPGSSETIQSYDNSCSGHVLALTFFVTMNKEESSK